jgi:hypothetical protein
VPLLRRLRIWQTSNMAVSKWLMRKSFDEAAAKAEQIKIATKIKDAKNAGLFTPTQEKLREELGLHSKEVHSTTSHCDGCNCLKAGRIARASRPRTRVIVK